MHDLGPMSPDLLRCSSGINYWLLDESRVFQQPSSGLYFTLKSGDLVPVRRG